MTDAAPLAVFRYGQDRYMVRSQAKREHFYLVDFGEPEFPNGKCDCMQFSVRIEPPMNNDEEPAEPNCKHCRAVQRELQHAADLCALAGIPFDPRIIPML